MRASVGCAKCHECAVGTLLGAFSYTLTPSQQALENLRDSVLARAQPAPGPAKQPMQHNNVVYTVAGPPAPALAKRPTQP